MPTKSLPYGSIKIALLTLCLSLHQACLRLNNMFRKEFTSNKNQHKLKMYGWNAQKLLAQSNKLIYMKIFVKMEACMLSCSLIRIATSSMSLKTVGDMKILRTRDIRYAWMKVIRLLAFSLKAEENQIKESIVTSNL